MCAIDHWIIIIIIILNCLKGKPLCINVDHCVNVWWIVKFSKMMVHSKKFYSIHELKETFTLPPLLVSQPSVSFLLILSAYEF